MKNGETVAAFERAFAEYVGASYAIALCNGTATLHTALAAEKVEGSEVAVPPLTMSATSMAVLLAGGRPRYVDVDPATWLMDSEPWGPTMTVSLFGLHMPTIISHPMVDDAAQTLRPHNPMSVFTSYSFQASKILPLGEGGMLATDLEVLAVRARSFSSLGYDMRPDQPRIDPATLKHPSYARHVRLGPNYRMNDLTAERGLVALESADRLLTERRACAELYRQAIQGSDWITPQHVPDGWTHDYWCYAVALESADLWEPFTDAVVRHGGERPYGAWRLTYDEPAFAEIDYIRDQQGSCPVAEDLQPRLVQFQTNDLASATKNSEAVSKAIQEVGR